MGTLQGQVAVVTGASGTIGSGLARAFLEAGATVIAPARSAASKARVEAEVAGTAGASNRLHIVLADNGTVEGCQALARYVAQTGSGTVDHVVSIAGGMAPAGTLTQATPENLSAAVADRVGPHCWLAKALVPLLKEDAGSSYTVITGMLGTDACPWPQTALTALTNAAAAGAAMALQAELQDRPQRVNELRICAVVRRDADQEHPAVPGMPAFPVSRLAAAVMEQGVCGTAKGQVIRVGPEQLAG